jgi:cytochrome P450
MLPAFAACCADMVSRWEGLVAAAAGEPCEVDVWPEMQRLTGDVISRAAFGSSYLEGRRIFELQGEQVRLGTLIANKIHIPGYMSVRALPSASRSDPPSASGSVRCKISGVRAGCFRQGSTGG